MERVYNGCTKVLYRRWILFLCEIFREFVDNYKIWDEKPGSAYKPLNLWVFTTCIDKLLQ